MCPCCIDLYDKQRGRATLPCLHPVCVDCATKNDQGECFYQREFIHCGHKYTKGEVLLLQQGGGAGTKAELCGVCEENATHKCQTCNELFCSADAARHPVARASKGHTVDPLPHVAAAVQNACETHKAMAATIYCVKCDKMACLDCLAAHPSHPVETVVKGLATRAQLIKSKMAAVQKKCDDLKLGGDNEAKQDLDFVTAHLGTTTAKIDEAFDAILLPARLFVATVENRKHELRKQAQDAIGADVKTLEQQVNRSRRGPWRANSSTVGPRARARKVLQCTRTARSLCHTTVEIKSSYFRTLSFFVKLFFNRIVLLPFLCSIQRCSDLVGRPAAPHARVPTRLPP